MIEEYNTIYRKTETEDIVIFCDFRDINWELDLLLCDEDFTGTLRHKDVDYDFEFIDRINISTLDIFLDNIKEYDIDNGLDCYVIQNFKNDINLYGEIDHKKVEIQFNGDYTIDDFHGKYADLYGDVDLIIDLGDVGKLTRITEENVNIFMKNYLRKKKFSKILK